MTKAELSLFDMDDFIRGAGAERVSECASRKLREILEDEVNAVVFKAKILARHAGRSRVTRQDIQLAANLIHGA
ncbi:hypothetical protein AUJ14_04615 [Candidatus Micrarchaeota archaeon CG1_02_55_22]|nr:MAG: hypothetical protein AUJ14_04615 [Candidatus Micrarchaeota archaeon CG1_02_55_22]